MLLDPNSYNTGGDPELDKLIDQLEPPPGYSGGQVIRSGPRGQFLQYGDYTVDLEKYAGDLPRADGSRPRGWQVNLVAQMRPFVDPKAHAAANNQAQAIRQAEVESGPMAKVAPLTAPNGGLLG